MKNLFKVFIVLYCVFLNAACAYRTDIVKQMRATRLAIEKQVEETRTNAMEGANKFRQDMEAKGYGSDNIEDIQNTPNKY